jgi:hypothetical protein
VEFDPPMRDPRSGRERTSTDKEKFGVTDPAIGLVPGNQFEKGTPSNYITEFGPTLRPDTGPEPRVGRNPYNFVALAGSLPWTFEVGQGEAPYGHDQFHELTGVIEFEATALTPCFVPEGFPYAAGDPKPGGKPYSDEDLRGISRRFSQMNDHAGERRFCIPGSSFKGALRTAVEAIGNSRFGVANEGPAHLYRRRVFRAGRLENQLPNGDWEAQEILFPREGGGGGIEVDNRFGLLAQFRLGRSAKKQALERHTTFLLPAKLAEGYQKQVDHPHYERHVENEEKERKKAGGEPFYTGVPADWKGELGTLHKDDVIYFTTAANSRVITNFGKNVNYLWPAERSLASLAKTYLPRKQPGLDKQTDLAEYLFGFVGDHEEDESGNVVSHPFRGQLRFETMWGPAVGGQPITRLKLAPLTSPASQGKSRPLYLAPRADGKSASFDDNGCEIRGRKFYWHQRYGDGQTVWPKHTFAGMDGSMDKELRREMARQCPPPIEALPAGVAFRGRIHFSNLTPAALGAVLFALQGDGSFDHAFHLGKAKPRGLGSFRIRVSNLPAWRIADRYSSLTESKGKADLRGKTANIVAAFRVWCNLKSHRPADAPLTGSPHLADYIRLHTWPAGNSIRYYPVNFNQYSWLPADDDPRGEPRGASGRGGNPANRPPAMKRARDLDP